MNKSEMIDGAFRLLTQVEAERDALKTQVKRLRMGLRAVIKHGRMLREVENQQEPYGIGAYEIPEWRIAQALFDEILAQWTPEAERDEETK